MDWQRHLEERAARYTDIARTSSDPRRRVQAKLTAGQYQTALAACNTKEKDPPCPFAPDHWLRQGCRRAQTGSCAIVEAVEPKAEPEPEPEVKSSRVA
jgi:hypothetical protein